MPTKTIPLTAAVSSPSRAVIEVVEVVSRHTTALSSSADATGGVVAADLRRILEPALLKLGFEPNGGGSFSGRSLSWVSPMRNAAVSVHGGRAHNNNDVLVAVLAAAAHRDVDWLIAVLPDRYKSTPAFNSVAVKLGDLAQASGIYLDLTGVTLVAF